MCACDQTMGRAKDKRDIYYRKAKDLNIPEKEKKDRRKSSVRDSEDAASGDNTAVKGRKANDGNPGDCEKGYVWLRLNMGYKNRVIPRDIISIMKACGIGKKAVGKIEIFNEFLYVALKESVADYAKSQLNGATYDRRRLSASLLR